MIAIREVNYKEKDIIKQIVNIHMKTFTGFFLTFMGKGFLRVMYSSYCKHKESGLLVALDDNKPVGFLAYSGNFSDLYKYMIKTKLIPFGWYSLGALFRKPRVFFHLIKAFLKPGETKREVKYLELSSIGVEPSMKSQGVGSLLINSLIKSTDFSMYDYINLETDSINNEIANSFYKKNGFTLSREYVTSEGRKMNEYRYYGE